MDALCYSAGLPLCVPQKSLCGSNFFLSRKWPRISQSVRIPRLLWNPWALYVFTLCCVLSQLNSVCIDMQYISPNCHSSCVSHRLVQPQIQKLPLSITVVSIDAVRCLLTQPITCQDLSSLTVIIIQLIRYLVVAFEAIRSSHFLSQSYSRTYL
jgi:hypothetical protein